MNKSPLTSILTGALGLSALASLILCYLFISYTRETRTLQGQFINANKKLSVVNGLANDALEYSKTHPAIIPVLQASGIPTANVTQGGKPNNK